MGRSTKLKNFFVKPAVLTQARTLTDSDNGKTYFLNAVAGFTITLPSPRGGSNFEFIVKTANTTGNYIIQSSGNGDTIGGQVVTSDINSETDTSVQLPGVQYVKIIANRSSVGDTVRMVSDGTYWYANGFCRLWDAIRFIEESASPSTSPSISRSASPSISRSASPSVSPSISPSES
jgi:hypothetical protein